MNNQEFGREFENEIHQLLQKTKKKILREKEIKKYSVHISGIDHLIICENFCIAIQDKYVKSHKPSNTDIHHFKRCVNDLGRIIRKKIIGIYLSLLEPTCPAKKSITVLNSLKNNEFIFINNENKQKLIYQLFQFLYEKNIYLYEDEDTIMMSENDDLLVKQKTEGEGEGV